MSRANPMESVFAGTLTMPPDGKRAKPNANTRMKRKPKTHGGTTVVVIEKTVSPRSSNERAFRAMRNPSQTPMIAEIRDALVNKRIVRGSRSKMIEVTSSDNWLSFKTRARPNRKFSKSQVKRADFSGNGWFKPRDSMVAL